MAYANINMMNKLSMNDGIISESDLKSLESDSNDLETSESEREEVGGTFVKGKRNNKNNNTQRFKDSVFCEQTTIIATKITQKCDGFSTEFEGNIFAYFPFQLFQFHDFNFTFEHGKFHSKICYESGYYCENDKKVNEGCLNLKYDIKLN